jgi:hypothetical protein
MIWTSKSFEAKVTTVRITNYNPDKSNPKIRDATTSDFIKLVEVTMSPGLLLLLLLPSSSSSSSFFFFFFSLSSFSFSYSPPPSSSSSSPTSLSSSFSSPPPPLTTFIKINVSNLRTIVGF